MSKKVSYVSFKPKAGKSQIGCYLFIAKMSGTITLTAHALLPQYPGYSNRHNCSIIAHDLNASP